MLFTPRNAALNLLGLGCCLVLPLAWEANPDLWPLGVVALLSVLHWWSTSRSEDPFLSTERVYGLQALVFANLLAYSLSERWVPAALDPLWATLGLLLAFGAWLLLRRVACRVFDIDLEYQRYSLPSKKLSLEVERRNGRLTQAQAALGLQLFVKEGLQFRRLSRVCQSLLWQVWLSLGAFLAFAAHEPGHFGVALLNSLLLAGSASSIANRATLHPGQRWTDQLAARAGEAPESRDADLSRSDQESHDESDEESEAELAAYLARRRRTGWGSAG